MRSNIEVTFRTAAAILGGYGLSSLSSIVIAQLLQVLLNHPLGDSVLISTTLSYLIFFSFFIFCFCQFDLRWVLVLAGLTFSVLITLLMILPLFK